MEENKQPELSLEDIMKEFGGEPELPEQEAPELAEQETPVSSDTIRLDRIQKAVVAPVDDSYQPADEEEVIATPVIPEKKAVEPFSEEWEPEYDAPMGNYTPPIVFKPKSRIQQLRAKLVAGPERKYYELAEKGLGKLQSGIFLCLVIFAVAFCTTVLYALGLVGPDRLKLLVFVQILCMLLSGLVGCYRMLDGLGDIFKLRFTLNTWLALSFIVCCIDGVMCLQQQRISCCALFCLDMILAQVAAHQKRSTQLEQMDTLRKAADLTALVGVEDYYAGKAGFAAVEGDPDVFMEHYQDPSTPEKVLNWYSLISFLICGMFGLFGVLRDGFATGIQITAGAMLLSMPATAFISMSRPEKLLSHRLHKLGSVLCGWKGVKALPGKSVYPLSCDDLFPAGSIKLNGMKFLGPRKPDTIVCYASSLICEDGGSLAPLFEQLLASRNGSRLKVEDLHSYTGGLSGVVDGLPISLGTVDFMSRMGIQVPKSKVSQPVCIAIDGELSGMFAVAYSRSRGAAAGLRTLCGYRNVRPLLTQSDFMLTKDFLSRRFKFNIGRVILPEAEPRAALAEKTPAEDATPIALVAREGLAPRAYAVTGAKMLRTCWYLGMVIHLLGGILGLAAAAALTMAGAQQLLTPVNLLLYSLIWMVPGFLVTQWTRVL